jgi:hypothetical protein
MFVPEPTEIAVLLLKPDTDESLQIPKAPLSPMLAIPRYCAVDLNREDFSPQ